MCYSTPNYAPTPRPGMSEDPCGHTPRFLFNTDTWKVGSGSNSANGAIMRADSSTASLAEAWENWQEAERQGRSDAGPLYRICAESLRQTVVRPLVRRRRTSLSRYASPSHRSKETLAAAVTRQFLGDILAQDLVGKWRASRRKLDLGAYLRTCLSRLADDTAVLGSDSRSRRHTARSNLLRILRREVYRTVLESRESWKAPVEWADPTCFADDCIALAGRVGLYLHPDGPVTTLGCQETVDETFTITHQAHCRSQFMELLAAQGVFRREFGLLSEGANEVPEASRHPIPWTLRVDAPRLEPDQTEVSRRLLEGLQSLAPRERQLLADLVFHHEVDPNGKPPGRTVIFKRLAPSYQHSWNTLNYWFTAHIKPMLQALALRLEVEDRRLLATLLTLSPDDIRGRGNIK